MRICKKCNFTAKSEKDLDLFVSNKNNSYGKENFCKSCKAEYLKEWREANPNYRKEYHIKNKEKENANSLKWLKENSTKALAITRKYQASKKNAVPAWFDKEKVEKIYKKAKELGYEVDHIVPLQGKEVCGLHVQDNLQCIPAELNRSKSNKLLKGNVLRDNSGRY